MLRRSTKGCIGMSDSSTSDSIQLVLRQFHDWFTRIRNVVVL